MIECRQKFLYKRLFATRKVSNTIIDIPGVFFFKSGFECHAFHYYKRGNRGHIYFNNVLTTSRKCSLNCDFYRQFESQIYSSGFTWSNILHFLSAMLFARSLILPSQKIHLNGYGLVICFYIPLENKGLFTLIISSR